MGKHMWNGWLRMTKQELLSITQEYAERGSRVAASVLEEFAKYPKNMQTKERLCRLAVGARDVLLKGMVIQGLDRDFTRATFWPCMDYLSTDRRAKSGQK